MVESEQTCLGAADVGNQRSAQILGVLGLNGDFNIDCIKYFQKNTPERQGKYIRRRGLISNRKVSNHAIL